MNFQIHLLILLFSFLSVSIYGQHEFVHVRQFDLSVDERIAERSKFYDLTFDSSRDKEYYLKRGHSKLKAAKILGIASLVALGAGLALFPSNIAVGSVLVIIMCPLLGTVGTIFYMSGRNALNRAKEFGFMGSGMDMDLKYVQHSSQLNFGATLHGIGLTLAF